MSEPYVMGSHAVCAGARESGREDLSPSDYHWDYNRMSTVEGLFGAGDTVGGSAHKFSSGSFTEGRLAGKGAAKYVLDHPVGPVIDEDLVEQLKALVFEPLENYRLGKNMIVAGTVSPNYFFPNQGLVRLEKIMDEYAGGVSALYTTNEISLKKALGLLSMLREDLAHMGAENLHQL